MRFDLFAAQKLNISRNKASELIKSGKILLNNKTQTKPNSQVNNEDSINLLEEVYVGRGALKLKSFLEHYKLDLKGKTALDIGSSTGGFVQILLQNLAGRVTALDVGNSQLDKSLKSDSRVEVKEDTDIREFAREAKFEDENIKFDVVTCDVSFISVVQILPDILKVAKKDIIILFKPQFEVGREAKRNKKGVVTDAKALSRARAKFELAAADLGLVLRECRECEVRGKEGNAEFFYAFNKG